MRHSQRFTWPSKEPRDYRPQELRRAGSRPALTPQIASDRREASRASVSVVVRADGQDQIWTFGVPVN